jgi:hypothetical protein
MIHEFGHHIYNYYTSEQFRNVAFTKIVGSDGFGLYHDVIYQFVRQVKARISLSEYALKNHREAFAEGFVYNQLGTKSAISRLKYARHQNELLKLFKSAKQYNKGEWKWLPDARPDLSAADLEAYHAYKDKISGLIGVEY